MSQPSALNSANMVPGIGPSPDRMLQARLFGYGDAQRYRLGINHSRLAVNVPKGVEGGAHNYGRDGAMRFDDNGGRSKNSRTATMGRVRLPTTSSSVLPYRGRPVRRSTPSIVRTTTSCKPALFIG